MNFISIGNDLYFTDEILNIIKRSKLSSSIPEAAYSAILLEP